MVELAATNTILQTIVQEHLRGRVMAYYTMAFLGRRRSAACWGGCFAEHFGEQATVVLGGVACIAGGVWFRSRLGQIRELVRPNLHPARDHCARAVRLVNIVGRPSA